MAGELKQLLPATYDGIGPFPMQHHRESGDIMRRSRYEFPHRDDQDQEPQGVSPLIWSGELLFLNGIEGYTDLWPKKFMEMKRRLKKEELAYLEHPLYGPTWGYFQTFEPSYTKDELNGCRVSVTFHRCAEDEPAPSPRSFDAITAAKEQAALADAGLKLLSEPPTVADEPGPSAELILVMEEAPLAEQLEEFEDFLSLEPLTVDTIAGATNRLRDHIATILLIEELQDARNSEVRQALIAAGAALTQAASEAQAGAAEIITLPPLEWAMGPLEIAVELYGTADRAPDVTRLNPTELFEYPRGATLKVMDL